MKDWTLEPILPALGDRAAAYVGREAKRAERFLLYMPLTAPHTPLSVNEPYKGKSGLGLYADFVMETDAIVGQVLGAIEKGVGHWRQPHQHRQQVMSEYQFTDKTRFFAGKLMGLE